MASTAILDWFSKLWRNVNTDLNAIRYDDIDSYEETVNLYLYTLKASPAMAAAVEIDDTEIEVDSIADVAAGDVLTIYEGARHFQTLVVSAADTTIVLGSPVDYAFTTAAVVHVGSWNLNLNGSVTEKEAFIMAPPLANFKIREIRVNMIDATAMDSSTFGGISALTNGILFRVSDGAYKNGPLIVNNIGFAEQGFSTEYDAKAPTGKYGVRFNIKLKDVFGSVIYLSGASETEFQLKIRDDLSGLEQLTCVVSGHVAV